MPRSGTKQGKSNVIRETGGEAMQLTIDYIKQESLGPLKATGRFLALGAVATTLLSVGFVLVLVGILRVLQTETGTALTGNWSWVPYFAVVFLAIVVIAVAAWRITKGPAARRYPAVSARVSQSTPPPPGPPPSQPPPPTAPPPPTTPPPPPVPAMPPMPPVPTGSHAPGAPTATSPAPPPATPIPPVGGPTEAGYQTPGPGQPGQGGPR